MTQSGLALRATPSNSLFVVARSSSSARRGYLTQQQGLPRREKSWAAVFRRVKKVFRPDPTRSPEHCILLNRSPVGPRLDSAGGSSDYFSWTWASLWWRNGDRTCDILLVRQALYRRAIRPIPLRLPRTRSAAGMSPRIRSPAGPGANVMDPCERLRYPAPNNATPAASSTVFSVPSEIRRSTSGLSFARSDLGWVVICLLLIPFSLHQREASKQYRRLRTSVFVRDRLHATGAWIEAGGTWTISAKTGECRRLRWGAPCHNAPRKTVPTFFLGSVIASAARAGRDSNILSIRRFARISGVLSGVRTKPARRPPELPRRNPARPCAPRTRPAARGGDVRRIMVPVGRSRTCGAVPARDEVEIVIAGRGV